jgi:hypothetical protein
MLKQIDGLTGIVISATTVVPWHSSIQRLVDPFGFNYRAG